VKTKLIIICILGGVVFYCVYWPIGGPYHCTAWVAHRARQRIDLVHPGMTAPQVWSTLGLSIYMFPAHVTGSGDPHAYPANYLLSPGDILYCRWNLTTNPPVLLEARFKNRLEDE
jgi:hypothetical protein